ncbi:MAG: hypothetical protein JOY70_06050 [Acidisphaera sp.]|nr:hypothetical protein [Acidisphaera sp.]MBV9813637.1 hypothetical protein [Acetobacteraceae bacterium]
MVVSINPWVALGVVAATAATDALYVRFTAAVAERRALPAANWSAAWYVVSSFAVISYTSNAAYVVFAALGSWIGAYASLRLAFRMRR